MDSFLYKQELNNTMFYTSLIDMYAKCGNIEAAKQVFKGMKPKSLPSWNAMISGLGMHGHADMALEHFSRMTSEEFKPDTSRCVIYNDLQQ